MGRLRPALGLAPCSLGLAALLACAHVGPELVHRVQPGENLFRISRYYGVSVSEIVERNRIADVTALRVGRELRIPSPRVMHAPAHPLRPPLSTAREAEAAALREGNLHFAWPLRGRVTSSFGRRGRRPHEGVDIAAPRGSLVRAAESGRVVFSGRMGGYGNVVIVRHGSAYATVYAHHRRNRVGRGRFIDKGAVVGEVGSSGNATGPHLHFELRRDEVAQDPLLFLP